MVLIFCLAPLYIGDSFHSVLFCHQSKNKVSLRNLSMVLRQLSGPPVEKVKLIEESIERAKEAVQLDLTDGTSWREFLFHVCFHSFLS